MNDKKPIFIQIKEFYERLIDIGALKEGDAMPSVREVALQYKVNPNTIQRSFSLMVEDGYLTKIHKKGFYVLKRENKRSEVLKEKLKELIVQGYSKEEIESSLRGLDK